MTHWEREWLKEYRTFPQNAHNAIKKTNCVELTRDYAVAEKLMAIR